MAWYRTGSIAISNGSKALVGTGTAWVNNVQPGDAVVLPDGAYYEVDVVDGNGAITLVESYAGTTVSSGGAYKIIPTQGRVRDLAAQVLQLIGDYGALEGALGVGVGGDLLLMVGGNEAARISAPSNFGLGTTPSPWNTSVSASQVKNASLWSVNNRAYVGANYYFNSSAGRTYIASDYAAEYAQISGAHSWSTAAPGTAGNVLSFTQTMTLDASGNLGIGTTSPAERLHVVGTLRLDSTLTTSATAGSASALPALPRGYITVNLSGTAVKIPYYST